LRAFSKPTGFLEKPAREAFHPVHSKNLFSPFLTGVFQNQSGFGKRSPKNEVSGKFWACISVLAVFFMAGCDGISLHRPQTLPPVSVPGTFTLGNSANIVWYVSADGNDSGSGTDPAKPLASVNAALDRIKSSYHNGTWKAGASATIVISGTITASGSLGPNGSMVDISGTGKYPPIILEGDPIKGGVLNAARDRSNEGRVLYIANNKVTLGSNLTLTGGYSLWGGAVCIGTADSPSEGEFIMAGGEISGNMAQNGGGVLVYNGKMTMTGGTIKNNVNSYNQRDGYGGGLYICGYARLTMSGGTITENGGAKTENGGGIFVDGSAELLMTGGEILKNASIFHGGGVYIAPLGRFTMSNGTISGNKTGISGGGIYIPTINTHFTGTGGIVKGNSPD
jgi:hypothetical protein